MPTAAPNQAGVIAPRRRREDAWEKRFELPTVLAALLVIPTIALEESSWKGGWQELATALNWVIWSVFLLQVITMLTITRHRRRWLGRHVLEVLIVLLTPPFLPAQLQAARVFRLLRLFRVVLTVRSMRAFFSLAGLRFATIVALFGVLGAGALFAAVEGDQHLTTWDGVWWAINQVTTTGSDITPHTSAGRAVSIAVVVVGVSYIAVLTGAMAQLFSRALHTEVDTNRELMKRIDGLTGDVAALREEIRHMVNTRSGS